MYAVDAKEYPADGDCSSHDYTDPDDASLYHQFTQYTQPSTGEHACVEWHTSYECIDGGAKG